MIRAIYLMIRRKIMVRSGFDPSEPFWWNANGFDYSSALEEIKDHLISPPNLAGQIHFSLQVFWEKRGGLGKRCLLVSESTATAEYMAKRYPATIFRASDLYSDLYKANHNSKSSNPDFIWDVNIPPPISEGKFNSVIANALLEHVIDPVLAISNIIRCLEYDGYLYIMTHTPSFHVHRYPKDYLRFNKDFWNDLPEHLSRIHGLSVSLEDIYMYDGVVCVGFRLNPKNSCINQSS